MTNAQPGSAGKLLLVLNTSWNIVNFRSGLVRGLIAAGYEVVAAAPRDRFSDAIADLGARYVELPMEGHSRSPSTDLRLLGRFVALMRRERPDAFLGYTVKPNVFGSIAAQMCGVPCINNIAGLGSIFNETGPTARIVVALYRLALKRSACVFFQNREDLAMFTARGLVRADRTDLLPGSGIDTVRFNADPPLRRPGEPFVFLLVARLLKEKGLAELAEATRTLRRKDVDVRVRIAGPLDPRNPASVSREEMDGWVGEGLFEYLGVLDDVRPALREAHAFVLPSYYREGTPRALLEAAAMARPIVTTDMPGCRDVVDDVVNGFVVPPRDADALAERMASLAGMPAEALREMGLRSRFVAERQFDERIVVTRYRDALDAVLKGGRTAKIYTAPKPQSASRS